MKNQSVKQESPPQKELVDFGFSDVPLEQKTPLVQEIFTQVAEKYDIMNDIMSFGLHRSWKNEIITELRPQQDDNLLDLAGGTGDIATLFLKAGGGAVTVCDLNQEMLNAGQAKAKGTGYTKKIQWVCANAEKLPFADYSFDYCTISFGIRNVTDKMAALREIKRVLKPGGKFVCLEFSHINNDGLAKLYDWYMFNIIPKLGKLVASNETAYQYLVESIKKFPKAPKFASMMNETGFDSVNYKKFTFGIVAMHVGYS
jgi:demethylmenaquinone methyltransferase/2-methoxy-6-polyprenyl-1,4-benzoquinol methylase